jgi:hypothetical protein
MSGPYPGLGGCDYCGLQVLWALDTDGDLVALDTNRSGPVVVRTDCTGMPRVRRVTLAYRPAEGERRAGIHNDACIGLAEVVSIGRAPSARRRAVRTATAPRKAVSARLPQGGTPCISPSIYAPSPNAPKPGAG